MDLELQKLTAAVIRVIRESLQAAHSPKEHVELLEALRAVDETLELDDEDEATEEMIALSEALDVTISDAELEKETTSDETTGGQEPDDPDDTQP